jgi:hypothetical protein
VRPTRDGAPKVVETDSPLAAACGGVFSARVRKSIDQKPLDGSLFFLAHLRSLGRCPLSRFKMSQRRKERAKLQDWKDRLDDKCHGQRLGGLTPDMLHNKRLSRWTQSKMIRPCRWLLGKVQSAMSTLYRHVLPSVNILSRSPCCFSKAETNPATKVLWL